ncbi:MAG: hypothetical protein M3Q07_07455, partial [Pseudobdellovibrionaceae bacterium]|nr:hypothetical protein [Pseudobdellovibrionaceae bacterium]
MLRHLLFALSVNTLTGAAHADTSSLPGDCILFEHADRQGAYWSAEVEGKDPASANLDNWWQDRVSSVWVRPGFILEAYPDPAFKGTRLDISRDLLLATEFKGGASVNLNALNFNDQLSSYRCRRTGDDKALAQGSVSWHEG